MLSKLDKAVKYGGCIAFSMKYKPDFPIEFLCGADEIAADGKIVLLGNIIHADDYQPFCDVIGDIISKRIPDVKAHARLKTTDGYRWYYISAKPDFARNGSFKELNGTMFDVTEYLDCEGNDAVMERFKSKAAASMTDANEIPKLAEILGLDYLERIQQPFAQIAGLYSQILDDKNRPIAAAKGQDKNANLYKMSYQRRKAIIIKHRTMGYWIIAGETGECISETAPLLDTMVQTVADIANSYIVIGEEMENSREANKLLGQNFEDQILINNIYSIILKGKTSTVAFGNVIPLIKEYFSLEDMVFCEDSQNPSKVYHWDHAGNLRPMIADSPIKDKIYKDLDNDVVIFINEDEVRLKNSKGRSLALARIFENGKPKGVLTFISSEKNREWNNRDRKLIKNIAQIVSILIFRSFVENELLESQEHLMKLAYTNIETGIPNKSAFERDLNKLLKMEQRGAVIAVEINNLKDVSEVYDTHYANEIVRSIAEYIAAIPMQCEKTVYRFSAVFLYVILEGADRNEAVRFAQAILTKFRTPWYLNESEIRVDINSGIAMFPDNIESCEDYEKVLAKTIKVIKEKKMGDVLCYSDTIEVESDDSKLLKKEIIEAAENDFSGFYFLYTPVVGADTGELISCEAHLFWTNNDVIVPRERFLPIINRAGYTVEIYSFVVDRICEFCAAVRESGVTDFRTGFAIPENILSLDESVLILKKCLLEYSLPPSAISILVSETDNTINTHSIGLMQLAALGVNIVVDDKGGKFFTDSFITKENISILKLRSARLSDDPVSAAFIKSIIDRVHERGMKVCIAGVDNTAALHNARSFDADYIMGIINGRPLHTSEFIKKMVYHNQVNQTET